MTKKEVAIRLRKYLNKYIRSLPDYVEYLDIGCVEDVVNPIEHDDVMLTPEEKIEKYGKIYSLELSVETGPKQLSDDFE